MRVLSVFLPLSIWLLFLDGGLFSAEFKVLGDGIARAVSDDGSVILVLGGDPDFKRWRWTPANEFSEFLPLSNHGSVGVSDLSADGTVAVGSSTPDSASVGIATVWTSIDSPVLIGALPGDSRSSIEAVSADGKVFAGLSGNTAFLATSADDLEPLLPLPGDTYSFAEGLSADGGVVVGRSKSTPSGDGEKEATIWVQQDGEIRTIGLGRPGGLNTSAGFVSRDGSTVVGTIGENAGRCCRTFDNHALQPFYWTGANVVPLGRLDGTVSNLPTAISGDASVIVGNTDNASLNFVWDKIHETRELQTVLRDEHGIDDLSDRHTVTILGMSGNARTLVGNVRECEDCDPDAWALFLDRPLISIPGDVDHDFDVDFADFLVLASHFDEPGTWEDGDFDLSGTVDFADFLALAENFGIQPVAMAAAVPEPTTSSLLALGLIALIHYSRRRHWNQPGEASC